MSSFDEWMLMSDAGQSSHLDPRLALAFIIVTFVTVLINWLRGRNFDFPVAGNNSDSELVDRTWFVAGMACERCADKVSSVLRALPGVREVRPILANKSILISFEPAKVQERELAVAIVAAGFRPLRM